MSSPNQNFVPESQKERWVKYGLNVLAASIIVVVLAGLVAYLAQKYDKRLDTTAAGMYSLKPQTVNIIKANKQKIKLVSLYVPPDTRAVREDNERPEPINASEMVKDLIQEYASKGANIEAQAIDPVTQSTDALVSEAISQYGGDVENFRKFISEYQTTHEQLKTMVGAEAAAVANFQAADMGTNEDVLDVISTIRDRLPEAVARVKTRIDEEMKQKFPKYKEIVEEMKSAPALGRRSDLTTVASIEKAIIDFAKASQALDIPEPAKKYLAESASRHEAIKKLIDDTVAKIGTLGELKVTELQDALKSRNIILVLGEKEWRVINPEQVWVHDSRDVRAYVDADVTIKPRFAGEQAVTTAILGLTSGAKPKVAFIRPGGQPLTDPGFPPFQRSGPLSELGERLRAYNFEVLEKDISGMWAMQARMQQMPSQPEPPDEAIKDAIWVVLDVPSQQQAPSPEMNTKLAAHLKNGGSALVLAMPQADTLSEAMKDFGVEMQTDATIVHEVAQGERARSGDWADEVQMVPIVFGISNYGDHMLTKPLQSLPMLLALATPVRTTPAPGVTQTPLLPIPSGMQVWGERSQDSLASNKPKYDAEGANPDLPGPFFAGVAAEKDKSRLIVLGGLRSFFNDVMSTPDERMLQRGVLVSRFPGNSELFTNSIFWLAKMEPMIAISPSAMQINRIPEMGNAAKVTWQLFIVALLPCVVLAAGVWMYFVRRD